jgi:acetylornithine deacetylase/succinyl-diaminopimelate desuccinylase-like protein
MKQALHWLKANRTNLVTDLAELVAIPSVSTDGQHQNEVRQAAEATADQMRRAGLRNVELLECGDTNPYAFGEWMDAPGRPTVFLYSHYDVQPITGSEQWTSDPWTLTARHGRLFGRGSVDDKGGTVAQLGAVAAFLRTSGRLPVNVKMVVEGAEEIGSRNLLAFFNKYRKRIQADVIVVCDTDTPEAGAPNLTNSLRGIVALRVRVDSAHLPVHSGSSGLIPDAALALNVILARLYWGDGKLPIPGYYDAVRPVTKAERRAIQKCTITEEQLRRKTTVLPGVHFTFGKNTDPYEQMWRKPSVAIIAQEAGSTANASNQVLPRASAIVSCRIVPDQDPQQVLKALKTFLTNDPPWGVKVTVEPYGEPANWWLTDLKGKSIDAALEALRSGFGKEPLIMGSGGTIGFVRPLCELLEDAPALLFGIEDPGCNVHAPNESIHEGHFRNLARSLAHLFANLGSLAPNEIK